MIGFSQSYFRLLVYLLLSERGWDTQFRDAYLEEALSRQVSWFTKDDKHPELLVLEEDSVAVYRLKTTFQVFFKKIRSFQFLLGNSIQHPHSDVSG